MSEDEKQQEEQAPKKPLSVRIFWRTFKISLILAVIVFILATVLSRLGGNGDIYREIIEDFLTESTPYSVRVTKLNQMRIFPNIIVDVEGVQFRGGADGAGEAAIDVTSAKFALSFIDVMFRPGRFRDIQITGLSFQSGALFEQPARFETISTVNNKGEASLDIKGRIGRGPLDAKIGLSTHGTFPRQTYSAGHERDVTISLGALNLQGALKNTAIGLLKLENITLSVDGDKALRGNFDVNHKGGSRFNIKGQGRLEPNKTQLDPNLTFDKKDGVRTIEGKINSDVLIMGDLNGGAPFMKAINEITSIFGTEKKQEKIDLEALLLNVDVEAKQIKTDALTLGSLKSPIKIKDSKLHIGPMNGKLISGNLGGDIHLDASVQPALLKNKITVKDFDYAELQKRLQKQTAADEDKQVPIEGKGDILIDLKSQGNALPAIANGLKGKVGFVGGKARMQSDILDVWGGGLVNAILPKLQKADDFNVECVVVNMDIENMKARSDSVFIDTKKVTLHGEGTYNFKTKELDMILDPKSKGISIGDIGAAVNVSGPFSDLKTTPNAFSLGKKVGGMLLGASNPAFFALTLADLGLANDHPCKKFVIEKESLPPPETKTEAPLDEANEAVEKAADENAPQPALDKQPALNE